MLTLATGDTIAGNAQTVTTITITMSGETISAGVVSPAVLYQGQPGVSVATLYTVPALTIAVINSIYVVNTAGSPQSFALYRGGTAAANRITPDISLPSNGFAVYAADAWSVYDNTGKFNQGGAFGTNAFVLGTAAAAGSAVATVRTDDTIAAFDATVPVTQAFSDAAATGSIAFASRRDHKHGMPVVPRIKSVSVLTSTSSSTYNLPAGITSIMVELIGGGGAGGSAVGSATNGAAGGGGGGGAYTRKFIAAAASSYNYQCGTGGTGGSGNGPGANVTQFNTSAITAPGGSGGFSDPGGTVFGTTAGGAGGNLGVGGDFHLVGDPGSAGNRSGQVDGCGGAGGDGLFGQGGGQDKAAAGSGGSAGNYGGGGGGALAVSNVTNNGGSGTQGVIIVTEYA